jgi:hypothetical protein
MPWMRLFWPGRRVPWLSRQTSAGGGAGKLHQRLCAWQAAMDPLSTPRLLPTSGIRPAPWLPLINPLRGLRTLPPVLSRLALSRALPEMNWQPGYYCS